MRLETKLIDPNENLCELACSISFKLAESLQVHSRWKQLLECIQNSDTNSVYHFSAGDVLLLEQRGDSAASHLLYEFGTRGMTVSCLTFYLEKLKWEQELRLLKVPEPVKIIEHPVNEVNSKEGEKVILNCVASGFPYPRYEWRASKRTGQEAQEFDNPSRIKGRLIFDCIRVQDAGKYVCRVTNDYSFADSRWCVLRVEPENLPPVPVPKPIVVHEVPDCGDVVDGQWQPPSDTYYPPVAEAGSSSEFGPYITKHPPDSSIHVIVGQPVVLSVVAHANPPPVFQWYRIHRDRETKEPVTNGGQSVLQIKEAKLTDNGIYYCEVRNHISSVSSEKSEVYIHREKFEKPRIYQEPSVNQRKMINDIATLLVIAEGQGDLEYQWFKDGMKIRDETKNQLRFKINSSKDAGSFQCMVTCPITGGMIMSQPARLDVKVPFTDIGTFTAQDKIALVIASSGYETCVEKLKAPPYDAHVLSGILTEVGFHVISLLDPTKEEIMKAVDIFCELLETPSEKGTAHHSGMYGVFYWAGHGCHHCGDSYLIPYNVQLNYTLDDCVSVEYIRSKMLNKDPSLCLLLLDMCRSDPGSQHLPRDNTAHLLQKRISGHREGREAAYGNHCTIYATSIGQEAFESKWSNCSIFMQCLTIAIKTRTKRLTGMFEILLEELRKNPKADDKQNPEIVSNLKQNRTLHDHIFHPGNTDIVQRRLDQWKDIHGLPQPQTVTFPDADITIRLTYEKMLSNVMMINAKVLRLGKAVEIKDIKTEHDPQKVYIVPDSRSEYAVHFRVWALQRLKTDLLVTIKLKYILQNEKQCETRCRINLGRPLIAASPLWNSTTIYEEDESLDVATLGAVGGQNREAGAESSPVHNQMSYQQFMMKQYHPLAFPVQYMHKPYTPEPTFNKVPCQESVEYPISKFLYDQCQLQKRLIKDPTAQKDIGYQQKPK